MGDQAALYEKIGRLEAALDAATKALGSVKATPDLSADLKAAQAALAQAEARAKTLEDEAAARTKAAETDMAAKTKALDEAERRTKALEAEVAAKSEALAEAQAQAEAMMAEFADTSDKGAAPSDGAGLRSKLDEMSQAMDALRNQAPGAADASLKAEVAALRSARALDLVEIQALLEELEPMLEAANA